MPLNPAPQNKMADTLPQVKIDPAPQVKISEPVPLPKTSDTLPKSRVTLAKPKMSDSEILTLINNFLVNSKVATEN